MRGLLRRLHRWIGLVAGGWLAVVGLTGAGLVAAPWLFSFEYGLPAKPAERSDVPYASLDVWIERAEAAYGSLPPLDSINGPLATPLRIAAPTLMYSTLHEGEYATGVVVVEPYSGAPLGHFIAHDSWAMLPLKLHMMMFLPYAAMWLTLAAVAWVLLALVCAGLACVRREQIVLGALVSRSAGGFRRLHIALGLLAAPLLLLTGVTGLLMADKPLASAIAHALGRANAYEVGGEATCSPAEPLSPGGALDIARSAWPTHELAQLEPQPGGGYRIALRPRGLLLPIRGDVVLAVDACGGVVTERGGARSLLGGDYVETYLVEGHNGRVVGRFGEALIFMAGLALLALPVLGIGGWLRRSLVSRRVARGRPIS